MVSLALIGGVGGRGQFVRTFAGRDRACSIHPNRVATSVIVDGAPQ
jgi:hypothetical protein